MNESTQIVEWYGSWFLLLYRAKLLPAKCFIVVVNSRIWVKYQKLINSVLHNILGTVLAQHAVSSCKTN